MLPPLASILQRVLNLPFSPHSPPPLPRQAMFGVAGVLAAEGHQLIGDGVSWFDAAKWDGYWIPVQAQVNKGTNGRPRSRT